MLQYPGPTSSRGGQKVFEILVFCPTEWDCLPSQRALPEGDAAQVLGLLVPCRDQPQTALGEIHSPKGVPGRNAIKKGKYSFFLDSKNLVQAAERHWRMSLDFPSQCP